MASKQIKNMKKILYLIGLITFLAPAQKLTLEKVGIIKDYGMFYNIPNPDLNLNATKKYKVIFDVRKTSNDINTVNPLLNTVARFINMHVATGIPLKNLDIVVIVHGKATKDILNKKTYKERFKKKNPNLDLLNKLNAHNVKIFVCGQSATHLGIERQQVAKSVKFALSALSVLTEYQGQGYQLIDFN